MKPYINFYKKSLDYNYFKVFTRMPLGPNSRASTRVNISKAVFAGLYANLVDNWSIFI